MTHRIMMIVVGNQAERKLRALVTDKSLDPYHKALKSNLDPNSNLVSSIQASVIVGWKVESFRCLWV